MYQPQRQQDVATHAQRTAAVRPVALCLLLLLSLLASLWQVGAHAPRSGVAASSSSASGEERGEKSLEEESPAKLRRVSSVRAPRATQPHRGLQHQSLWPAYGAEQTLIPAAPHQAPPSLHSPRRQRGQAPPLA